jgi:hypothetical protein
MSITSSIYAEYANKVKNLWVEKLEEAYNDRNWVEVHMILSEMGLFYFVE